MKRKGILSIIMALCLVAVVMIGATLAYFTSSTGEVVNTFTVGNVSIDLTEPGWKPDDAKNLQPGASVAKDPQITNTGEGDGYILMMVSGMEQMAAQGFSAVYDSANWDLVDETGKKLSVPEGSALKDGYYVYNKGALKSGATTTPLFSEVKLSEDAKEISSTVYKVMGNFQDATGLFTYKDAAGNVIEANEGRQPSVFNEDGTPKVTYTINGVSGKTFATAEEAKDYVLENYKESAGFVFDLTVQGFAIQTTNIAFEPYTNWVGALTGKGEVVSTQTATE